MTREEYLIRRKLNILELSDTLGNISDACRKLGVSRQHYYDIKDALKEDGLNGLLEKARNTPRLTNRVQPEIEKKVLEYALEFPTHGQVRAANELNRKGYKISACGVRCVWLRHGLERKQLRLKNLEKWAQENKGILTESQVQALENSVEEKEAQGEIETFHPGFLLGQDTFYIGYIKGIGKIYQQTCIDTYSNIGFAKVYRDKTPVTAADMINDKVLPFFDEYGLKLIRILTDRGTEYCGIKENHAYELFLHLSDIEHSRTKVRHPQTNGSTEKLNQTIYEEFYKVAFRKALYGSVEQIQNDLDKFMIYYNEERTNQGKNCKGRTPMETFLSSIEQTKERFLVEKSIAGEVVAM